MSVRPVTNVSPDPTPFRCSVFSFACVLYVCYVYTTLKPMSVTSAENRDGHVQAAVETRERPAAGRTRRPRFPSDAGRLGGGEKKKKIAHILFAGRAQHAREPFRISIIIILQSTARTMNPPRPNDRGHVVIIIV